jgi:methionyl-tRNA formyltransferase
MFIDEGEDTGDVISQRKTQVLPEDTSETLFDRLSLIGAELLIDVLRDIDSGDYERTPQDNSQATYARRLKKEDGRIKWESSAQSIRNLIRGTKPWPGTFTYMDDGRLLKVHDAIPVEPDPQPGPGYDPGTLFISTAKELFVKTGDSWVKLISVQPECKKAMLGEDFVNGYGINTGDRLT